MIILTRRLYMYILTSIIKDASSNSIYPGIWVVHAVHRNLKLEKYQFLIECAVKRNRTLNEIGSILRLLLA